MPNGRGMTSQPESLLLTSPHSVAAALPYLLGFEPRECVVMLWVRASRLILTQRLDLPDDHVGPTPGWIDAAWLPEAMGRADEVVIALVSDRQGLAPIVAGLMERSTDVEIRDILRVHDGRWWSLLCEDDICCPAEGRAIDPVIAESVRQGFVSEGVRPLAGREEVEAECRVDPRLQRAVGQAARSLGLGTEQDEQRRDDTVALIMSAPGSPTPVDLAITISGLGDVVVRDTVLWEMLRCSRPDLLELGTFLRTCVRSSTKRGLLRRAPVATVAAVAAWLAGDGVRANTAIDAALDSDPSYSLAILVGTGLRAGLSPEHWRDSLAGLTRDQCRGGVRVEE